MIRPITPLHRVQRVSWVRKLLAAYLRIASDPTAPLHEREAVRRLIPMVRATVERN